MKKLSPRLIRQHPVLIGIAPVPRLCGESIRARCFASRSKTRGSLKEGDMKDKSKVFLILGCFLLIIAAALRITQFPIIISTTALKASSLLHLANTAFILAVLFKK
jgi:hypothetical protein